MEILFGSIVCKIDGGAYDRSVKPGGDGGNSDSPNDQNNADLNCSICLEPLADRTTVKLQCSHLFHLDCIGSAFNKKNKMQCPICRNVEQGTWLFADTSTHADVDIDLPDFDLHIPGFSPNYFEQRNSLYDNSLGDQEDELLFPDPTLDRLGLVPSVPRMSDLDWYVPRLDSGVTFSGSNMYGQNLSQVVPRVATLGMNLAPTALEVNDPARQTQALVESFRRRMMYGDYISEEGESSISGGRGHSFGGYGGRNIYGGWHDRGPF